MARSWLGISLIAGLVSCATAGPGPSQPQSPSQSSAASTAQPGSTTPTAATSDEPVPAGMYRILLTRPDRVGARARLRRVTTDVRSTRTVVDGRVTDRKTAERRVRLEAVSEILAVDADGRATKTRYLVEKLEADSPKGALKIVPSGTEIVVVRSPGTPGELRIGSEPLDDPMLQAVKAVLPTSMGKNTDQRVFGSDVPRAVGDTWQIDAGRARAAIEEVGIKPRGPAKGTTRLVEKRTEGGEECLFVLGQLELERFDMPDMPPEARTRRAKLRMRFSGSYPIDLGRPVRKHHVSISMEVDAVSQKGKQQLGIVVDSQRETQSEIEPL